MRATERVSIRVIQKHLEQQASGVRLNLADMPGDPDEYRGFKASLGEDDAEKLVLYWEFQDHTKDRSCRLTDVLESAASIERVKPLLEGNSSKGYGPIDLRSVPNKEPTILTDDLTSRFLYVIDGNHRTIAHYLGEKSFETVPVYVCVHPQLLNWAYLPNYYK